MAMELIWPAFPREKLRMFFILHDDDSFMWLIRSTLYYRYMPLAVMLLVASLVGSVALYLSLAMSSAREDESGERGVLERWASWGIPLTLGTFLLNLIAMVLFLIGLAPYLAANDFYIYKAEKMYQTYAFAVVTPVIVPLGLASIWLYFHAERMQMPCMQSEAPIVHVSGGGEQYGEM